LPTFTYEGVTVYYTDTAPPPARSGAPTVLFGHGLLFGGWMFRAQISALRDDYRCVAVDWRGQGNSAPSSRGYDMDSLTADVIALIDQLGIAPVHYVGLSMGGFVGARLAARRGELLRSLTLLDTSAGPEDPDKMRRYKLMARIYRLTGISPLRTAVQRLMFGPAFLAEPSSKPVLDEWHQRLRKCRRSAISKAVLAVANRAGVDDEITTITVPTLVIVGADDAATPPHQAKRIAARIPGACLEQIPHCGHSSAVEQPDRITTLLRQFLSQHS
jgi:3-oxoadipate enol-lactonase